MFVELKDLNMYEFEYSLPYRIKERVRRYFGVQKIGNIKDFIVWKDLTPYSYLNYEIKIKLLG